MKLNSMWFCRKITCLSSVIILFFPVFLTSSLLQAQTTSSSFQSTNFPDRDIRHKNFIGYIDPIQSDLDRSDASFIMVPGLADKRFCSFRSVNFPDQYLRHQNFALKLQKPDWSDLYKNDATFKVVLVCTVKAVTPLSPSTFPTTISDIRTSAFISIGLTEVNFFEKTPRSCWGRVLPFRNGIKWQDRKSVV